VKVKFRELARKYHPDKSHGAIGDDGGERFKWARKAYDILCNPESRRSFDNQHNMAEAVQRAAAMHRAAAQKRTSAGTPQADARKRPIDETTPLGRGGDAKRPSQGGGGGGGRDGVTSQVLSCPTALPGLEVGACHPLPSSPARAVLRSARAAGMGGA